MYAAFFGLQHAPFSIAPDPRYLFMSDRHREALAHLLYGLDAGGGFVLLTGEIGTGKTTVCRCFLEQIPAQCNVAYIFNPKLTVAELLRSICDEFGVAHAPAAPGAETVKDCIDPLNAFLLQAHAEGRNNVLIIDEAQSLAPDVLEQLRLLTNLETSERKLLQIILIGQPELRDIVAGPALEQLAQRVIARFHLDALSPQETQHYIAHRLAVAGRQGPVPFDRRAIQRVHALTQGVPRRINLLCDRALLGAYAAGQHVVTERIVRHAAQEVFGRRTGAQVPAAPAVAKRWWFAGAGALVGAAAMAAGGWLLLERTAGAPPIAGRAAGAPSVAASESLAGASAPAADAASAAAAPSSAAASASEPLAAASAPPVAAAVPPLQQFLSAQSADDAPAWRTLAAAWGAKLPDDADPCAAMPASGLRCYRNRRAGLNLVQQLDRPVLLTLYPAQTAEGAVAVVLRRLDGETATLEGGGHTLTLPVAELAQVWRGDMATVWRAPPRMPEKDEMAEAPAAVAWLDRQLASKAAGGPGGSAKAVTSEQRRARIHRFQLAQGLVPDGRAGPMTLMLLNRAAGVNEPRLRNGA